MDTDITYDEIEGPVRESGFAGYIESDALDAQPCSLLPGATSRLLSHDPSGARMAMLVDLPRGYSRTAARVDVAGSIDIVVLDGHLEFGGERLGPRDFAFVAANTEVPQLATPAAARLLLFVDPPPDTKEGMAAQRRRPMFVTRYDDQAWQEAALIRDAGLELDLAVQMLKVDPATTARAWYVRLGAGGVVPWERHTVVEEGYLIEGDYRLAERLPARTVIGDYRPGGYFRRPAGVVHSGPRSGTSTGAIWLQRSPAALDVTFVTD